MAQSLYDVLGVPRDASAEAIRAAYRKLARTHHPDVNPGDAAAEARFKQIAAANEVLADPARRKAYDEFGEAALAGNFDAEQARAHARWQQARQRAGQFGRGGDVDFADLFGARPRGKARGADVQAAVAMELRQALDGTEVTVEVPGQGQVRVRIPPGADNGSTIRVAGKGHPGARGGAAGDLVIEIEVRPHPHVRREGLDLYLTLPLDLDEAYSGGPVEVPTFDGPVVLKVPPRSQPGATLRLRGKGVRRKDARGDLLVQLAVRLPDQADDALAAALRASKAAYSTPVRRDLVL